MKKQITRISPHQNGKVFGILTAISSLVFIIPMGIIMFLVSQAQGKPDKIQYLMLIMFPFMYLVFGYIMTAIGCLIYNLLFKFIGGFEYEGTDKDAQHIAPTDAQNNAHQ
jgi:hypothetical protein